jgi:hypothetical protein
MADVTPESIAKAMNAAGIQESQLVDLMQQVALQKQRATLQATLTAINDERVATMTEIETRRQDVVTQIAAIDQQLAGQVFAAPLPVKVGIR